jgi:hypothetical protein
MPVSAFVDNPSMSNPVASGRVTARIADNVFAVTMTNVAVSSPVIEVGSRVVVQGDDGSSAGGLVAKVHGNGTFAVLRDDDAFLNSVTRSQLSVVEGTTKFANSEPHAQVVKWIRDAGVARKADAHSAASILFRRGWRANKLYLLESEDVHCLHHLNKSVRMGILEAADAERDRARYERESKKEQMKEKEWRYFIFKYSTVVGAVTATFGALSVFTWNWKNWRKAQRPAQVETACNVWTRKITLPAQKVCRLRDEKRLGDLIQSLDTAHPRVVILAGNVGTGKTMLTKTAAMAHGLPAVFVELRGADMKDPVRAIAKALGAWNFDVCGDLFTFIEDVATEVIRTTGTVPLVVLKLHDDDTGHVYNDAVTVACDRRVAHVLIEVSSEVAKRNLMRLPRTELFHINEFTPDEAREYVGHRVDPVALEEFVDVIGTNSSDLDEFIAAVTHRHVDAFDFIAMKLQRTIADVRGRSAEVQAALREAAESPYEVGLVTPTSGVDEAVHGELLYYQPAVDSWRFRTRALFEAARAVL